MSNIGKNGKEFNPTVTAFFDAPKFGQDANENTPDQLVSEVTTKNGGTFKKEIGTAFLSMPIDAKAFEVIKNVKQGDKFLLRMSRNLNKNGGRTFFLEVISDAPAANADLSI